MLSYLSGLGVFFWEIIKVTLVALAIILPIRYFLVQPFYVKGASMEPSFYDHDYLLIDEISYRFSPPSRADVMVIRYPRNRSEFFIKRLVALPGERLVVRGGQVFIGQNQAEPQLLNEPYLGEWVRTRGEVDVRLGADQYYVLGDNRGSSLDSRSFGPITAREIVGRTWLRAWPFERWTVFRGQPVTP
ncbi:MAG: signal peptidase I [Candidatus Kerfeldbacteria bacterium]|nr:signal peptidase I [Candidatus Kerfeldbacteria bacterium]